MNFNDYFPIKKHINHAKKSLGQNFLIDRNILEKISNTIDISNRNVLEIGGGIGNLTVHFLEKQPKSYSIIEKDEHYADYLKTLFNEKITVINDDCLNWNGYSEVLVGNLPYNIATKFIENSVLNNRFSQGLFLIQREVAERIVNPIKSKNYGPISVICQYLGNCTIKFSINGSCFWPQPRVISSLIYIERNNIEISNKFGNFVHHAFLHRRKKYWNNLCPDQISPDQFGKLFHEKYE